MEDKGIFQTIIERFAAEMNMDSILGEELSAEIIKLIGEDKCKKEQLERILKFKNMKTENENS
ncbi:MAG: hypothetical protein WA240_05045 [Nitrospirota bacterium]